MRPVGSLCWLWLAVGLRFVLPWGIPLRLPRPESAPLAAADTVQELGELPLPLPRRSRSCGPLPWYARLTPWHALAAVWLVGVLVLAVRGAVGYLKLKRCVALACKRPTAATAGVRPRRSHWALCARASTCRTARKARRGRLCCCMSGPTSAAATRW